MQRDLNNPFDPTDHAVLLPAPGISPNSGTYTTEQYIKLSCAAEGASIRYTTNGAEPNEYSTLYTDSLYVSSAKSIKAKAFKTGWEPSSTNTASYSFRTATPSIDPPSGSYASSVSVTLSCATSSSEIRYTTNGSEPTSLSTLYTSPVLLTDNTTIKAAAFRSGWDASYTSIAAYTITVNPPPAQMLFVQGGSFFNGSSTITVSDFFLDRYEVTQAAYQAVMGNDPAFGYGNGEYYPVYNVSWFDSIEYCNRRSLAESLVPCYSYSTYGTNPSNWPSGWNTLAANHANISCSWTAIGYRLPTEMEWMFAARGGTQTHSYTYSGSNTIGNVCWYDGNNTPNGTKQVGTKIANELGMYDMSGNTWEWVWDISGSYPGGNQTNPHGATSGTYRCVRGGSWTTSEGGCEVAYRNNNTPTLKHYDLGFRVLRIYPRN
jgi:formylglycine-generating enzyme required for sulfatase activity